MTKYLSQVKKHKSMLKERRGLRKDLDQVVVIGKGGIKGVNLEICRIKVMSLGISCWCLHGEK